MDLLEYGFMQRALLAAVIFGPIAPLVGIFLVQRRMALLGDGMGHIATTGIGLAMLLGTAAIPTAMVVAALGALLVEFIRERSRTAGDLALALIFYGGIAGGVMLVSLAGTAATTLNSYLFGSLTTVSASDLVGLTVLAVLVVAAVGVFGRELFVVTFDPDIAAVQGIPVRWMNRLVAVLAAVSVVVGMQVVGLLMVSAMMIVPIATAQQVTRSFRGTMGLGVLLGLAAAVLGLVLSFYVDVPPGPTIVLLALATFGVVAAGAVPLRRRLRAR